MTVATLSVHGFRNLRQLRLSCSPRLNLITGANGAGKTSLLEALFLLSRGRSFRSRLPRDLIGTEAAALRVVAEIERRGRRYPLGVERSPSEFTARVEGRPLRSLLELAEHLPVLLLNPDSHRLLQDGPRERRQFMDWGLFHTEAEFVEVWRRYRSALKNRNALLRDAGSDRSLAAWETELAAAAERLDLLRRSFCETLQATLEPLLAETLGQGAVTIDYRRGWTLEQDFAECLLRDRPQDRQYGYTRHGPHRADFIARSKDYAGRPAATERLSRGQQKLLVIALTLAQARLYQRRHQAPCVLLIDDLPAELDPRHRGRVMHSLARQPAQLFVTAIDSEALDLSPWPAAQRQRLHLSEGEAVAAPD